MSIHVPALRSLAVALLLGGATVLAAATNASAATSFGPAVEYAAGGGDVQVVGVGDFDADGNPDVVVANEFGDPIAGTFTILLGNADGTFADEPVTVPLGGIFNSELRVADVNDDDRPDLLAGDSASGTVQVALNNGDLTFTQGAPATFTGDRVDTMVVGDFDGDGTTDLAAGDNDTDAINVLLGNGDGTFTPGPGFTFDGELMFTALAAGDFDDDGHLDLAVGDYNIGQVTPLFGDGTGAFTAGDGVPVVSTGCGCSTADAIAVGDLDGDGDDDIVGGANYDEDLVTMLSGPARTFTVSRQSAGGAPTKLELADVSGDGLPDLVGIDYDFYDTGRLMLKVGNGSGGFAASRSVRVGDVPTALAVADFNHDDKPDAVVADQSGVVHVALNTSGVTTTVAPTGLTFADQPLSTVSAKQTVTVTNSDTQSLRVTHVDVSGPDADDLLVAETCTAAAIPAGGTCTVSARLIPSATGTRTATLTISHDGGGSALTVPITGTGTSGATGPAGPQGPAGPSGTDGADGGAGPQGPAGADGDDGAQGPKGDPGDLGLTGPAGAIGPAGADGATGPTGPVGPQGTPGATGAAATRLTLVLADKRYRATAGKRRSVAFGVTLPGKATLTIVKGKKRAATISRTLKKAGASTLTVPRLGRGSYTLKLVYTTVDRRTATVTARYVVARR